MWCVPFTVGDPVKDEGYFMRAINETDGYRVMMVSSLRSCMDVERVVTCSWELGEVAK
jgi:CO dehydrogenase/acetyl-CoA synthase delta subunit